MSETIRYEVRGGVAIVTLNRPERLNAINAQMGAALTGALIEAAGNPLVGAMIITGEGRAFCAGGDADFLIESVVGGQDQDTSPDEPNPAFLKVLPEAPPHYRTRYSFAAAMPIPTFAAVNGSAVGAGLALALSCDFRFGTPHTKFIAPFSRIGMTAELGLAWTLTNAIGRGPARDMLLSARPIGTDEALRWGLITQVFDSETFFDQSLAFAQEMVKSCSPRSIRALKAALDAAPNQSFAESFEMARLDARAAIRSDDFREGIAALREKRAPNWPGQ